MTFYATLVGYLEYRTSDHLDAALHLLRAGDWLDSENRWQTDRIRLTESLGPEPTIDDTENLLVLPLGLYADLVRVSTDLFPGAVDGTVVMSSTDCCFDGWIERPLPHAAHLSPGDSGTASDITCYPLEVYARSRGLGMCPLDAGGYTAWQNRVVRTFHREFDLNVTSLLEHTA